MQRQPGSGEFEDLIAKEILPKESSRQQAKIIPECRGSKRTGIPKNWNTETTVLDSTQTPKTLQ